MDRYAIALGKKPLPVAPLDKVTNKDWVAVRRKQQQDLNLTREFLQYFSHPANGQMIAQQQELQRMRLEQEFNSRNDRYIHQATYEAMRDGNWNTDRTP
jgi:hypothetical protein